MSRYSKHYLHYALEPFFWMLFLIGAVKIFSKLDSVAIIDSKRSIIIHIQLICDLNHTVDNILINIIRKLHNMIGIEGT